MQREKMITRYKAGLKELNGSNMEIEAFAGHGLELDSLEQSIRPRSWRAAPRACGW